MIIYTDGSCNNNPGTGGYSVVLLDDDENFISCYAHREEYTTNNRQEMKAILWSFLHYGVQVNKIKVGIPIVTVYSDSSYAINCFNDWMFKWQQFGWVKTDLSSPQNLDLLQAYYDWYKKGYRIELKKVKGHADNKWNILADNLTTGKLTVERVMKKYGTPGQV